METCSAWHDGSRSAVELWGVKLAAKRRDGPS